MKPESQLRKGKLKILTLSWLVFIFLLCGSMWGASSRYPEPEGNVNDYAGILSQNDLENLNALINSVLEQTGVTFAIAIVEDHGDEIFEFYVANLFEAWGIGEKGEDNGLLVVMSMSGHDLKMEVGYGLEHIITDRRAGECLDKMLPYFRENEFGKGLYAGLYNAAQYIAKEAGIEFSVKPVGSGYDKVVPKSVSPLLLVFVASLGLASIATAGYLINKSRRCPKCKYRLSVADKIIRNATLTAEGLGLRVYKCPACGYSREENYRIRRIIQSRSGWIGPFGPGPFIGGGGRGSRGGGGFSGPKGFGGGRSGGGGASRKW
jgi:uncharacterized protein